jgi:hypothetical protein
MLRLWRAISFSARPHKLIVRGSGISECAFPSHYF